MNKPNVINVTFISKWEEGNIETPAKLDVSTGRVFDIESSDQGAEYEHLVGEFIRFEGDPINYPVAHRDDDDDYAVTNDILMKRLGRMTEIEVAGVLMSRDAFERRFEYEHDLSIPPDLPVRIVATNEAISAGDLYARFISDAKACIERRIHNLSLYAGLGEFLYEVSNDPESQLSALRNDDKEAIKAIEESIGFGAMACEAYLSYSNETLAEMIESAVYSAKDNMERIEKLSAKLQGHGQHRALVVVSGGTAETIADAGVDIYVFDKDNYKERGDDEKIPVRFNELVARFDSELPVENEKKKVGTKCRI